MVDSTSLSLVSLRRATKVRNTSLSPPRFQECGSHEPSGFRSHGPGRGGLRFFLLFFFHIPKKEGLDGGGHARLHCWTTIASRNQPTKVKT